MISVTVTKLPCVCTENPDGTVDCNDQCIAGKTISDGMIETEAVAQARGRAEIYANYSNRMMVNGNMPFSDYIKPGKMLVFTDVEKGDFISLVNKSEIVIRKQGAEYTADLQIQLEREA